MSLPSQNGPYRPNPNFQRPPTGGNSSRSNFQKNYNNQKGPRKNERIRANEIRVIGPDGAQVGIMTSRDGLTLAKKYGLDLVEISANASPPVCRIVDFGKYMYEESKKQKNTKKNVVKLKEIKLRPAIDKHDYDTKIRHAESFLEEGNKVKMTLSFRGREMENTHIGFDIIKKAIEDLKQCSAPDAPPKMAGRNITLTLSPHHFSTKKDTKTDKPTPPPLSQPKNINQPFNKLS